MPRSPKKVLLQTQVDASVGKRFDEMAKANGHKRASYLRFIVEMFVKGRLPKPTRLGSQPLGARTFPKTTAPTEAKV